MNMSCDDLVIFKDDKPKDMKSKSRNLIGRLRYMPSDHSSIVLLDNSICLVHGWPHHLTDPPLEKLAPSLDNLV